jgi:hypothetical protein
MDRELPRDPEGIQKAVECIFAETQGGDAILWLGERLGKEVQKVNKTQVRKFLTELKAIKKDEKFKLDRFRWVSRYLVAQEKSSQEKSSQEKSSQEKMPKGMRLLGNYLDVATKQVSETYTQERLERLQSLVESVYAHYLYYGEAKEGR